MNLNLPPICDPCKETKQRKEAHAFCIECRDIYCASCVENHRNLSVGKDHVFINLQGTEESHFCDICSRGYAIQIAHAFCLECREVYCEACYGYHREYEQTRNHPMLNLLRGRMFIENGETEVPSDDLMSNGIEQDVPSDGNEINNADDVDTENKDTNGITDLDKENGCDESENSIIIGAKFQSTFYFKTLTDTKPCTINRMVAFPNDRILVLDTANYKIKLFSDKFVFLMEYPVPPLCTAIACIDEKTFIVTIRGAIKFFNVEQSRIVETQSQIRINGGISDIIFSRGTFIISFQKGADACICRLKMDGSVTVIRREKNRVLNLYDFIQYDVHNSLVFQSNFDRGTVTCIAHDGSIRWTTTVAGGPAGLAVGQEYLYVAVYGRQIIQLYSLDGRLINGQFLTPVTGVAHPCALTYQNVSNSLLVSKSYQDNIAVFSVAEFENHRK